MSLHLALARLPGSLAVATIFTCAVASIEASETRARTSSDLTEGTVVSIASAIFSPKSPISPASASAPS